MNKLLVITGPTATGKTVLGLRLAKKYHGEILSADSRQVYKGMDIGTGKDINNFQFTIFNFKKQGEFTYGFYDVGGVKVWGLDIVEPGYPFNVSDYVNYANAILGFVWEQGKLPIIVGGTGQYIKELLLPSETLHLPPDEKLREELNSFTVAQLQERLQRINGAKWEQMNQSDRQNSRRLIRAIEVATAGSDSVQSPTRQERGPEADILLVGLTAPSPVLYERIDKRVEQRFTAGMEEERKKLSGRKLPNTIGYRGETATEWKFAEHAYARRQMTYLKHQLPRIVWFDVTQDSWSAKLERQVGKWYTTKTV